MNIVWRCELQFIQRRKGSRRRSEKLRAKALSQAQDDIGDNYKIINNWSPRYAREDISKIAVLAHLISKTEFHRLGRSRLSGLPL